MKKQQALLWFVPKNAKYPKPVSLACLKYSLTIAFLFFLFLFYDNLCCYVCVMCMAQNTSNVQNCDVFQLVISVGRFSVRHWFHLSNAIRTHLVELNGSLTTSYLQKFTGSFCSFVHFERSVLMLSYITRNAHCLALVKRYHK